MGPGDLAAALASVPSQAHPNLLVGRETFDDAGIYRLSDELALVQTVDFFAPIVDDPFQFGQVAAANSLSDIFAMGGEPLTAMNIVAFPEKALPLEVLGEILRGGQSKVHEAGAVVVGGHTILDEEIKYGLSVTGRAHPGRLLTNAAARPGDRIVLTKPLGTGILATALKNGHLDREGERVLVEHMTTLNAAASRAALELGVRCATDVTGFGLLGHAGHIAKASSVTLEIEVSAVPLMGNARELAAAERTGGSRRNLAHALGSVEWRSTSDIDKMILVDPQTSGGLLLCMPPSAALEYLSRVPDAVEIGEVLPAEGVAIRLT
jgi:selenide, water dikinase